MFPRWWRSAAAEEGKADPRVPGMLLSASAASHLMKQILTQIIFEEFFFGKITIENLRN